MLRRVITYMKYQNTGNTQRNRPNDYAYHSHVCRNIYPVCVYEVNCSQTIEQSRCQNDDRRGVIWHKIGLGKESGLQEGSTRPRDVRQSTGDFSDFAVTSRPVTPRCLSTRNLRNITFVPCLAGSNSETPV
jgi:hypothetical protein